MRIGIDAKWLFRGPPSGRRVVRHLVDGLAKVAAGDELHLFLDARARGDCVPLPVPAERQHFVWARNNQIANLWAVPRAADRLGLDAVVYQNFAPPRLVAHHARIAFVYDVIFESHPEFFTWRERLYFASLRRLTASADGVCTLSANERGRLVRMRYAVADRVAVVPIAVDPAFVPRDAQGADAIERVLATFGVRGPFVLFAGRLNARKNVAALVRAMALVRAPGMTLAVVGASSGPALERLVGVAAEAGVTDRVRWLGAVSDEDLRALYAAATLFCFPSFDEGFGLPPLEAMASGTPVIVTRTPALEETCGDAAEYLHAPDPASIAAAIDALAGDDARRGVLRAAGLRRAATFTRERTARALLARVHAAVSTRR